MVTEGDRHAPVLMPGKLECKELCQFSDLTYSTHINIYRGIYICYNNVETQTLIRKKN